MNSYLISYSQLDPVSLKIGSHLSGTYKIPLKWDLHDIISR